MSDSLLETIQGLIRRGDELHAQRVAELEKAVAGLQEVLRDLAGALGHSSRIPPALNRYTATKADADTFRLAAADSPSRTATSLRRFRSLQLHVQEVRDA